MKKLTKNVLLITMVGALVMGCYPSGPDYVEDLDVVYTTHNESYDFKAKNTFSLPDKIVTDVKIDNGDTTYVYMKDKFAQPVLAAIESNMLTLGWTKVDISAQPDILVTPAAWTTTSYFYSYWYDWWYGGWYGGWGWYYPPYYSISSFTTGTLAITIADPNEETPTGRSETKWLCAINGLYAGTYSVSRATELVDKAFTQSPYLNTK